MTTTQKVIHIFKEYRKISKQIKAWGGKPMKFYKYFPMKWDELKYC